MSARRILGLEQTLNCSPHGKPWGNNRAQNGGGHTNECSTLDGAWFTPWERRFPKSTRPTWLDSSMGMEPSWPSSSDTVPNGSVLACECGSKRATQLRQSDVQWLREEFGVWPGSSRSRVLGVAGQRPVSSTLASSSDSTICAREGVADRDRSPDSGTQSRNHRRSSTGGPLGRCIVASERPIERTASEHGGNDPGNRLP
jgi:hypothetical protein